MLFLTSPMVFVGLKPMISCLLGKRSNPQTTAAPYTKQLITRAKTQYVVNLSLSHVIFSHFYYSIFHGLSLMM